MLEKYIVCDACGLRPRSFESSSVLYITPTYTSSMQELIMQGMQQKWEKSCFLCKNNTWNVESNGILQPPKYWSLLFIGLDILATTKGKCSIPMDMTVVQGLQKFSLHATIDRHGPSIYSGHYTASIKCCKNIYIATTAKLLSLGWLIPKTPILLMW